MLGQPEYTSTATLTAYQDTMEYRTTYYTIKLNGKGDAPSLDFVHDYFHGDADSTMMDYEQVWKALENVPLGSEVPVKWAKTLNNQKVFTEINGHRKIGGHMLFFYHSSALFLWFYFGITYVYLGRMRQLKQLKSSSK